MLRKTKLTLLPLLIAAATSCGGGGGGNDTVVVTPDPTEKISQQVISNFLWKPNSERDGNLAILVNPENTRILITGAISEEVTNHGPSNGRGTTGRTFHRGCHYGQNVIVEFFESDGTTRMQVREADGALGNNLTIPNGCDRFEFRR